MIRPYSAFNSFFDTLEGCPERRARIVILQASYGQNDTIRPPLQMLVPFIHKQPQWGMPSQRVTEHCCCRWTLGLFRLCKEWEMNRINFILSHLIETPLKTRATKTNKSWPEGYRRRLVRMHLDHKLWFLSTGQQERKHRKIQCFWASGHVHVPTQ